MTEPVSQMVSLESGVSALQAASPTSLAPGAVPITSGLITNASPALVVPIPPNYKRFELVCDQIALGASGDYLNVQCGFDPDDDESFAGGPTDYQFTGFYSFAQGFGNFFGNPSTPYGWHAIKASHPQDTAPVGRLTIRFSDQADVPGPTLLEILYAGWRDFLAMQHMVGTCIASQSRIAFLKIRPEYSSILRMRYELRGEA